MSEAPIITKNNINYNSLNLDIAQGKEKCIVCGSYQDWKEIIKYEISKENENIKQKQIKDIQVTANKLGFGSYSKFLEKCDHQNLLSDININPSTYYETKPSIHNTKFNKFQKERVLRKEKEKSDEQAFFSNQLSYSSSSKKMNGIHKSINNNPNEKSIKVIEQSEEVIESLPSILGEEKKFKVINKFKKSSQN